MIYNEESTFSEVKAILEEAGGYCDDIKVYLADESLTGKQIIDKFREDNGSSPLMKGRIINAIKILGKHFNSIINDEFLKILMERDVDKASMLILWRKIKDYSNISDGVKELIINYVKGTLPNSEKNREWFYINQEGYEVQR